MSDEKMRPVEQYTPRLGKLAKATDHRDAIHVAVAPVIAGEFLDPGADVWVKNGVAYMAGKPDGMRWVGIADPFMPEGIKEGERFWLLMYPNTVSSLRHVWTHPAFEPRPPEVKK